MNKLKIEWKHPDVKDVNNNCNDTGQEIKCLCDMLSSKDIITEFIEIKIDDSNFKSDFILFNDIPIEKILNSEDISQDENEDEDITANLVCKAAFKVLGMDKTKLSEIKGCKW